MVQPVNVEYIKCSSCGKTRRTLTKLNLSEDISVMVCKTCCSPDFIKIWKLYLDFKVKTTSDIREEPLKIKGC